MSKSRVYSIHGRGLKLDSKEDIEPYLRELQAMTSVEEIHIGGRLFLGIDDGISF
jgi:Ran GTPase-activating protein 1